MISLRGVKKEYGKGDNAVLALSDIDLDIEEGKFTAIIGKSGSGKSTLMNIIGALDGVSEGSVIVDGLDLTKMSRDKLADYRNKNIGYIFQSFYLEPTFTVLENVALPLSIAGVKKDIKEKKSKEAIARLGLVDKTYKKANELSGGQKQRAAIARAIAHDPSIILADEPTGNLDSGNGAEVIALLKAFCAEGRTVILVTHNMEDASAADVIVKLKDGKIDCVEGRESAVIIPAEEESIES